MGFWLIWQHLQEIWPDLDTGERIALVSGYGIVIIIIVALYIWAKTKGY